MIASAEGLAPEPFQMGLRYLAGQAGSAGVALRALSHHLCARMPFAQAVMRPGLSSSMILSFDFSMSPEQEVTT